METIDAIMSRRSVRKYKADKISDELIEKILAAGMQAPSAMNEQPWHFIVIKDRKILSEIPKFSPYAAMAKDAPLAILVCGDTKLEKIKGFWFQDCSACIQNILLAAHAMGIGAVWTAAYPLQDRVEGYKKLLDLPESVIPLALIPMGYPDERPSPQSRFKKERVHINKWLK